MGEGGEGGGAFAKLEFWFFFAFSTNGHARLSAALGCHANRTASETRDVAPGTLCAALSHVLWVSSCRPGTGGFEETTRPGYLVARDPRGLFPGACSSCYP